MLKKVTLIILLFPAILHAKDWDCSKVTQAALDISSKHLNFSLGVESFIEILKSSDRKKNFVQKIASRLDIAKVSVFEKDFKEFEQKVLASNLNDSSYCLALNDFFNKIKNASSKLVDETLKNKNLLSEVKALAVHFETENDKFVRPEKAKVLLKEIESYSKNEAELISKIKINLASKYAGYLQQGESDSGALVAAIREYKLSLNVAKANKHSDKIMGEALFDSLLRSYDIHNKYFNKEDADSFFASMQANFVGLGVKLNLSEKGLRIVNVIEGGPAKVSGKIFKGDVIIAVEGDEKVVFGSLREAVNKIKGPKGSTLKLKLLRGEEVLDVSVRRGVVVKSENKVVTEIFEENGKKFGYLQFGGFYNTVAADVLVKLKELNGEQVEGLIIDMRDNGGGSLSQVSQMLGYFIGSGPTVTTVGETTAVMRNRGKAVFTEPIIVMINRHSASAAEILSGSLQAYNRAIVVGSEQSYGKGLVQSFYEPRDEFSGSEFDGLIKLTIAGYYIPNGKSPQGGGVKSDIILEKITEKELKDIRSASKDNPLMKSLPDIENLFESGDAQKKMSDEEFKAYISQLSVPLIKVTEGMDLQKKQAQLILSDFTDLILGTKDSVVSKLRSY